MRSGLDRGLWDRIATIFDRALDVRGEDRAALLDQLCGSDETIRREVEGMLEAHEESPGLIAERRLAGDARGATPEGSVEALDGTLAEGARVGPYRIVSLIGSGGMGDVYRAERADGAYSQTVALKVLRPGYRTSELVRRFRIEREALARLVHPGIATILDGGALDDGRPYIVLEFVDGVPVTTFCRAHGLSLKDRLALFVRIASTVQFAHGRLVVHRDLKPSNILVQPDGTPRLLDFGIAKLLDVDTAASLGVATTPEVRLLTPEHAAPEQLRGEAPTTATDVYALGVLLFEMLTGANPFPAGGRTVLALERAILDTPAPAPSSVVAAGSEARRLRGDLDRIVLMALRKEAERRYVSAGQFAEDVERYLAGRPVVARPDSVGYRVSMFVRRNRALVAGGSVLTLLLAGFAIMATLQARRISRERDRAERERLAADDVLRILTGLFERGNPSTHPGGDTLRVTSLLDDAEAQIGKLSADTARQAALLQAVGRMREARGEYARAMELLTRAYEQRRRLFGPNDLEALRLHHEIAQVQYLYRGADPARPFLDSSLTELRRVLGEHHPDVRAATSDLLMVTYDSIAARELIARLAAIDEVAPDTNPLAVAERLNDEGSRRWESGRRQDAVALFRSSLEIVRLHLPAEHNDVRTVERNLAAALYASGQLADAEAMQRRSLAVEERLRSTVTLGMTHEALAITLVAEGKGDSAEVHEWAALKAFRTGVAPEHWRIWSALRNLAFIAAARGRAQDALALMDSAVAAASAVKDAAQEIGYLTAQRIPFLVRLKNFDEAGRSLEVAERQLGTSPAVSRAHRADVHRYAGMLALALGDAPRAVERFRSAVSLVEPPADTTARRGLNTCLLGVGLARMGRMTEARPLIDKPCSVYLSKGLPDPQIVEWISAVK
jgi:serine/threonine-protein kinase